MAYAIGRATCFSLGASGRAWLRDLQWISWCYLICVVWAGGLTSRSLSLSGQLTFWPALAMREVGESQPSSADCLAALVAYVIKRLRREEAGQATVFSKRAFSHFFQAKLPVRLKRRFLPSVYQ